MGGLGGACRVHTRIGLDPSKIAPSGGWYCKCGEVGRSSQILVADSTVLSLGQPLGCPFVRVWAGGEKFAARGSAATRHLVCSIYGLSKMREAPTGLGGLCVCTGVRSGTRLVIFGSACKP